MNSQEMFHRIMDRMLLRVNNFRCYVEEVVSFSGNEEENLKHLAKFFELLKKNGLRLRTKKCSFMQSIEDLIGHIFEKIGVQADEENISKMREAYPPTTRTELRYSLEISSHCRRFIPGFPNI